MKYPIGTKLEFNAIDYTRSDRAPDNWISCTIVGESTYGSPIVEVEGRGHGWQKIFDVGDLELLRPLKLRTEWWTRYWVDTEGVPHAANFKSDRVYIDMKELPSGCVWHGDAFSLIIETDQKEEPSNV